MGSFDRLAVRTSPCPSCIDTGPAGMRRSISKRDGCVMWLAKWQWKIQLPLRTGTQLIAIVVRGSMTSVTTRRRAPGAYVVSRAASPRASTR